MPARALATLLASLLILALVGQGMASDFVWCIGEDGHAALEVAVGGNCQPEPQDRLPEEEHFTGDEHCGPCLDLPGQLELVAGRSHDEWSATVLLAPLPLPHFALAPTPRHEAGRPPLTSPFHLPQTLRILRTTVLLN